MVHIGFDLIGKMSCYLCHEFDCGRAKLGIVAIHKKIGLEREIAFISYIRNNKRATISNAGRRRKKIYLLKIKLVLTKDFLCDII